MIDAVVVLAALAVLSGLTAIAAVLVAVSARRSAPSARVRPAERIPAADSRHRWISPLSSDYVPLLADGAFNFGQCCNDRTESLVDAVDHVDEDLVEVPSTTGRGGPPDHVLHGGVQPLPELVRDGRVAHGSSSAVGRVPAATGPVDGARGAATPGAGVPTVGEPADAPGPTPSPGVASADELVGDGVGPSSSPTSAHPRGGVS